MRAALFSATQRGPAVLEKVKIDMTHSEAVDALVEMGALEAARMLERNPESMGVVEIVLSAHRTYKAAGGVRAVDQEVK